MTIAKPSYDELSPDLRYKIWEKQNRGAIVRGRLASGVKAIAGKAYWIALTPLIAFILVPQVNDAVMSAAFIKSIWELNPLGRSGEVELSELDADQKKVAQEIIDQGKEKGLSEKDIKAALMLAQEKSELRSQILPSTSNRNKYLNRLMSLESGFDTQAISYTSVVGGGYAEGAFQFTPITVIDAEKAGIGDPRIGSIAQQAEKTFAFILHYHPAAAAAIDAGQWGSADSMLNGRWTSLPGGAEEQNIANLAEANKFLQDGISPSLSSVVIDDVFSIKDRASKSFEEIAGAGANQWQGLADRIVKSAKKSPSKKVFPIAGQTWESSEKTSPYGDRIHPITGAKTKHFGQDFAAPEGTPIVAVEDGTISDTKTSTTGCGIELTLTMQDGTGARYCHLSRVSASIGQKVSAGDAIGAVGSTGGSTGAHLHFERIEGGASVDPLGYLEN